MTSRREFFQASGAALALAQSAAARIGDAAGIRSEISRRASRYLRERYYLVVDYYRIRRTLAYPLPVRGLSLPTTVVPTITVYPWATWMMWALEERIHSLGWAAEWEKRADCAQAAAADLEALAAFPKYCQYTQPDLSSGHAGRLMWAALRKWRWVGAGLRAQLQQGCAQHVGEVAPLVEKQYGRLRSKQDLLSLKEPFRKLANIPLIGTAGVAMTANAISHPAAGNLNRAVHSIFGAILDLRSQGHTEGVAYDGYILDFIADWLDSLDAADRGEVLRHPNLRQFLEESYMLAAPGAMEEVAQLSDVEPREMPFHYSAQAKLETLAPDALRAWYLSEWRPGWIRADALGALLPMAARLRGKAPRAGALEAHYAAVLRTGWEADDLAAVVSCTTSPMSHVQNDNGTVAIGTRGRWIVADPGYQQYVQDAEREFTLGPAAHNYPHPGGAQQTSKRGRLTAIGASGPGVLRAEVDVTACYPASAGLTSVRRTVWHGGRSTVVIADRVESAAPAPVDYHWHGHPDAAWWADRGQILLHLPECDLWIGSPNLELSHANIERHPGSRGQLTLAAKVTPTPPVIWWVFTVGSAPARVSMVKDGRSIEVAGKRFEV
jgi:hypothetical protein